VKSGVVNCDCGSEYVGFFCEYVNNPQMISQYVGKLLA
jgi:hypothetical protein